MSDKLSNVDIMNMLVLIARNCSLDYVCYEYEDAKYCICKRRKEISNYFIDQLSKMEKREYRELLVYYKDNILKLNPVVKAHNEVELNKAISGKLIPYGEEYWEDYLEKSSHIRKNIIYIMKVELIKNMNYLIKDKIICLQMSLSIISLSGWDGLKLRKNSGSTKANISINVLNKRKI